ncbi:UNVERIFIED_CONTAM: hypothetical protein GTU68_048488, partial [Idotea baltica]|nr:hypothetical protein [Idotea baltica]
VKEYRVYQVDAFTTEVFRGNPAGVVTNADGLSDTQMQDIARELNNSETAFILSPTANDHDIWIRFFTPSTEVPICGHATIASHFVRAIEENTSSSIVRQKSGVGILPVETLKDDLGYQIVMTQGTPEFSPPFDKETSNFILTAIGIEPIEVDTRCPMQIVSTGHSKVLIGINSLNTLHQLKPSMTDLSRLSSEVDCNGFFVFTLDSDDPEVFAHGRMFAPAIGIPEDPVTGNANGPLGAYLAKYNLKHSDQDGLISFRARQGEAIGRVGDVDISVSSKPNMSPIVKIAGRAVVAFKTEISL